ncbi:GDP-fucose protein O-fucosyltransferase 1 [Octopus bimaculoides]|uniref:GDP-fucose protein O-fucosyltransferase 1 n=1 Tax=Octopus bimaculoides TaxID=37653 RepID=A0A0L8FYR8_OCTBM|nr:GDP-fucose protein O-fucosyltransferase 1 [Octopus bimaculoides]|eukprot:XP_014785787.1 PREDICTED: GDP-fucose protein O-fucosyltransferase 1-like [Octopus bimaculoides]
MACFAHLPVSRLFRRLRWQEYAYLLTFLLEISLKVSADDVTADQSKKLVKTFVWDERGYLIYCPCMGRFGNQAEQFLGALGFAKAINRTLVLPPWRTYKNIPFDEWFRVEPLSTYHSLILAEDFMAYLAPTYWPPGNRTGWCFSIEEDKTKDCRMKEGNPFGPFWDGLGVDFDANMPYTVTYQLPELWKEMYPSSKYPVVAMRGAPSSFPVAEQYVSLHKYLYWSDAIEARVNDYIEDTFEGKDFIGIHLRNGVDWVNACANVDKYKMTSYMASPQCLGYRGNRLVTHQICLPSADEVIRLTKTIVTETGINIIFVATDKDPMIEVLEQQLKAQKVQVFHLDPWLPQLDLAILEKSKHFIGNCISSFSSFVARARLRENAPTSYWGFS